MIVGRYANRIALLTDGNISSKANLQAGLDRTLRPFIDYSNRSTTTEVVRCTEQFLSPAAMGSNTTAAVAVKATHERICQTLFDAAAAETLNEGLLMVRGLKAWLAWTTWKKVHWLPCRRNLHDPHLAVGQQEESRATKVF
jgi:hypothetical protein